MAFYLSIFLLNLLISGNLIIKVTAAHYEKVVTKNCRGSGILKFYLILFYKLNFSYCTDRIIYFTDKAFSFTKSFINMSKWYCKILKLQRMLKGERVPVGITRLPIVYIV